MGMGMDIDPEIESELDMVKLQCQLEQLNAHVQLLQRQIQLTTNKLGLLELQSKHALPIIPFGYNKTEHNLLQTYSQRVNNTYSREIFCGFLLDTRYFSLTYTVCQSGYDDGPESEYVEHALVCNGKTIYEVYDSPATSPNIYSYEIARLRTDYPSLADYSDIRVVQLLSSIIDFPLCD